MSVRLFDADFLFVAIPSIRAATGVLVLQSTQARDLEFLIVAFSNREAFSCLTGV